MVSCGVWDFAFWFIIFNYFGRLVELYKQVYFNFQEANFKVRRLETKIRELENKDRDIMIILQTAKPSKKPRPNPY